MAGPMIEESFMKSLFHGVIAEPLIFPFPEPSQEETDNVNALLDGVRKFCAAHVDSRAIDREEVISREVIDGLKSLGVFGVAVPKTYGGLGFSQTGNARVMQEIAGIDASIAAMLLHHSNGIIGILLFGTEEQKTGFLPALASGEHICAFALSERDAGSDAAAIQTRADLIANADRASSGDYSIKGSKIWVTNGGVADLFTVFARTSPAEEGAKPRITAFLVPRGDGITTREGDTKLGLRGSSTSEVTFDNVRVPAKNILGETGRGYKVAMEVRSTGRLTLAAGCLGMAKRLIKMSVDRVQERKAFGRPIGEFGFIKDKLALMLSETYALESMMFLTTGLIDATVADFSVESAICKIFGSEALWRVANDAMQIAAGLGYTQAEPFERFLRDARAHLIVDGTNEILRCFVALSGMQGPGKNLEDVAKAMREPIKGFGLLSDFAIRKARTALGRERLSRTHPVLNREALILEEATADLARNVDKVLKKHGKNIAEMQYTQKRIAEIAIDLYATAAVLARTTRVIERRGEEGARREIDVTTVFVAAAEKRLIENVAAFERNDDELRKGIASRSYADGGYPFDVF
jgi:acyl-CoA dehydrogenase family protein 9